MVSCISVYIRTSYTCFSPFHIIVWSTDYGKKYHTPEFWLADCILMSHLNPEPMFTSQVLKMLCCAAGHYRKLNYQRCWNVRERKYACKENASGSILRFVCLMVLLILLIFLIFWLYYQYNIFVLYWHLESYRWQHICNILFFKATAMGNLGISFSIILCTSLRKSFNFYVFQLPTCKPELVFPCCQTPCSCTPPTAREYFE